MPNFGFIIVVLFIIMLVMGPEKAIPAARSLGKFMRGFRDVTQNLTAQVTKQLDLEGDDSSPVGGLKDLANGLKSELAGIMGSVDSGIGEVRKSVQSQNMEIRDSLGRDLTELRQVLAKESGALSQTITAGAQDLKETVVSQAAETQQTLESLNEEAVKQALATETVNPVAPQAQPAAPPVPDIVSQAGKEE
jgi:Sec-independent protein translocase protein TatA